jgi:hypothetical protein
MVNRVQVQIVHETTHSVYRFVIIELQCHRNFLLPSIDLPVVGFSKAILLHNPQKLVALRVRNIYWNDGGRGARIQADLARFQAESEF